MKAIRWSDEDRYFGRFTYANENKRGQRGDRRTFGMYLASGHDDYPECRLRLHLLGHTLIVALPQIIKPVRQWHEVKTEPTRSQMLAQGREPGYWEEYDNSFGFLFSCGNLHLDYGAQTHDSRTDKSKCYFLPWLESRFVRRSFYGLSGEHVATLPETGKSYKGDPSRFDRERAIADATPTLSFKFADFDGEELIATTRIEEREWKHGTGYFKWMSLFVKGTVNRYLDIKFSGETGKRKGSWKGGTIGHSIAMRPGELHEPAFRRFCAENSMTFIGLARDSELNHRRNGR